MNDEAMVPAMETLSPLTQILVARILELQRRVKALNDVILWADGQGDDFPERQPGEGAYWWRKELMRRAEDARKEEQCRSTTQS